MLENLQDYQGNKVTFRKWENNRLFIAKTWICNGKY